MAIKADELQKAYDILSRFERQLIEAKEFKWDYITDRVAASKVTLWRNKDFKAEYDRVQGLVKGYIHGEKEYSLERSQASQTEKQIKLLKDRIQQLEKELERERERLAYAAMIARQNNIDPMRFIDKSPLSAALTKAVE